MSEEHHESRTVGEGHATKVSVSMPMDTIEAVKEQVGKREFSRFVTEAVERELRQRRLDVFLAAYEREHGPIPRDVVEETNALWREAEQEQGACPGNEAA